VTKSSGCHGEVDYWEREVQNGQKAGLTAGGPGKKKLILGRIKLKKGRLVIWKYLWRGAHGKEFGMGHWGSVQ